MADRVSFLHRRVTWREVAASLGAIAVVVAASFVGYGGLAILALVIVWLGTSLASLISSRRKPGSTRVQESTMLPWSADQVWALIAPAETGPVLDPSIQRGYQVPGTPTGVGERQAFELIDGTTSVIEIVEHVAGRRAVAVQVSPKPDPGIRYVYTLDPIPTGCVYTYAAELTGHNERLPARFGLVWQQIAQAQFDRIRRTLTANDV